MKRQILYDLIKYHFSKDEIKFIRNAKILSRDIKSAGDEELSTAINKMIRSSSKVVASNVNSSEMILSEIQIELLDVLKMGIHKNMLHTIFLKGKSGTGKTMFVKEVAKVTNKELAMIHLSRFMDARLGESMKNLSEIFQKIKNKLIFIDEIDSIAYKRDNTSDLHEISRILNTLLQLIDDMDKSNILFVATNMFSKIDKAFTRRFDIIANFDHYSKTNILDITMHYFRKYNINKAEEFGKHFIKLIETTYSKWSPAYIQKSIKLANIWQEVSNNPEKPLLNIMHVQNFGTSNASIATFLKQNGTPLRTISFFTKIQKDAI